MIGSLPERVGSGLRGSRRPSSLGVVVLVAVMLAGLGSIEAAPVAASLDWPATPAAAVVPAASLPPVVGLAPSSRVAAFYYPWYGGSVHWADGDTGASLARNDINSDYYPKLGPYDSMSRAVVAQHMAWLRSAGAGVIVSSWWGRGSREDRALPVVLEMAARYGIKVAFHIENYAGRTAKRLAADVAYLYRQFGRSPAFFRMKAKTPYDRRTGGQGLFFLWSPGVAGGEGPAVAASYWRAGIDVIHASAQGGLVVASTTDTSWIAGAHLDGLYNYVTADGRFEWARSLPAGALFVPSVTPGFSARRIGYPLSTDFPRNGGATYDAQWKGALATGVEPALVTITSFNEWHEGTQIEPAAAGKVARTGRHYLDYAPLGPGGYLSRTRTWVDRFGKTRWPAPVTARIGIETTADWTTVRIGGALVTAPRVVARSGSPTDASFDGTVFALGQPLADASADQSVGVTWEVRLAGLSPSSTFTVEIERGDLGGTTVTLYSCIGTTPVAVESVAWSGVVGDGRNRRTVEWPARVLLVPVP